MKSKVKKKNYGLWLFCWSIWLLLSFPVSSQEQTQNEKESEVRSQESEYPMSKVRDFFFSLPPRLKSGALDLDSLTSRTKFNSEFWRLTHVFFFSNSPPAQRGATRKNFNSVPQSGTELKSFCSDQTIEILTTQLLRDLPNYANRVSQRARRLSRQTDVYSYMLVAGKPEFAPLPLNPGGYSSDVSKNNSVASERVEQVFFTTLERLYVKRKAVQLQQFHWLFLTKTKSGWRLVTMYSQIGHYPANEPPTPPRESSNGVIAQAVNTWLRDCQAGSVRF